jgi:hypothetical protein
VGVAFVARAQESELSEVHVQARPWGATIAVDGHVINTVEKLWLKPGIYTIHVSLPGFEDWEQRVVIYGPQVWIAAPLNPLAGLYSLPYLPELSSWASASNKARFVIYFDQNGKPYKTPDSFTLDLDRGTIQAAAPPINSVDPKPRLSQIDPMGQGVYALVFRSPTGRYFLFVPKVEPAYLHIYDARTAQIHKTDIVFSGPDHGTGTLRWRTPEPEFSALWSPNEHIVMVTRPTSANPISYLLFLGDQQPKFLVPLTFKNEAGETVSAQGYGDPGIMARPAERGYLLTWGHTLDESGSTNSLLPWLVDLGTMIGKPLPINGVFDAAFSPDEKWIYVVHKRGITRLSFDFSKSEFISDVISSRWGVCSASISPTVDYVYIDAHRCNEASNGKWLYKLPR